MKYIPAEKLIAEIERLKERAEHYEEISLTDGERSYWSGESGVLELLTPFITSLQQEQPEVDLKEEFHRWLSKEKEEWGGEIPSYGEYGLFGIARHFYELGQNARKED